MGRGPVLNPKQFARHGGGEGAKKASSAQINRYSLYITIYKISSS